MKLGIMQPYFLPYPGYISLIKHTDLFILLDEVQFIRHGWIERNRMLKPEAGWQYISCPLQKHSRDTRIADILIKNEEPWDKKIIAQLDHYKKKAPYFKQTIALLEEIFSKKTNSVSRFNEISLNAICNYIGFDFKIVNFKDLNLSIEEPKEADEWALNICKSISGAKTYINPIGGTSFFDREKYKTNQIELFFQKYNCTEYRQKNIPFESNLSIIDVLMFNSTEDVNKMLDNYELV